MVSIIIPLYNAEAYIEKTIQSCLNQTYKNIEIIVVDDCSVDKSYKIVDCIMKKEYPVIKLYKNEVNSGLIFTVNKGLEYCKGRYIITLGNDDTLKEKHIENMISIMKQKDCSFIYCGSDYIDENDNIIGKSNTLDIGSYKKMMARRNIINSCGLMVNRKYLDMVRGYPSDLGFKNYGEWYLWIRLLGLAPAVYTNEIRSNYRIHSLNLTKTLLKKENIIETCNYNLLCMKLASGELGFRIFQRGYLKLYRLAYRMKMNFMFFKRGLD